MVFQTTFWYLRQSYGVEEKNMASNKIMALKKKYGVKDKIMMLKKKLWSYR
jgi:hypothetical protein